MKKLDRLDKIDAPTNETSKINFSFQVGIQPGKIMTTIDKVSKSYGDLHVLKQAEAEIVRGDKIALIGANGKGKSTLLRLIAGTEGVDSGSINPGHNTQVSFYAQHQLEALNVNYDIMDELKTSGSGKTEPELRELMGCFLFRGDDVFKKIKVLSGGEKARVALAKTIISKANYLLLDEPTNHLDISSVNMLIQALNKFEGTYVLVSHDRYFIQNTANKIWEIEDGKISIFDGNYSEWEDFKKRKALNEKSKKDTAEPIKQEVKIEVKPEPAKQNTSIQKEKNKEEKKLRNQFNKLESDLEKINFDKSRLELSLADPSIYSDKNKFQETESQYNLLAAKAKELQVEYEKIFEQLMSFEI